MSHHPSQDGREYTLPALGSNPSTDEQGTTPGSFAMPPEIGPGSKGKYTYASPDTPGMPAPSNRTAWDFL
ncbi:MAG: thiamine biosynthesis protein ThiC, partial [Planctomycetaceae bacterium]|nr:thiamine biosynthesis protein ThiC [Planctomycetaceae bacterium]